MSKQEIPAMDVQNILGFKRFKKAGKPAKSKKVLDGETCLYRHFDKDGLLLYVGISLSAIERLRSHRRYAVWYRDIATIAVERFPTRWEALLAERVAIEDEKPLHNSPDWPGKWFTTEQLDGFRAKRELERFCESRAALAPIGEG